MAAEDIQACKSRKSTVSDKVDGGCGVCFVYCGCWLIVMAEWDRPGLSITISDICAFPAVSRQNVCCEKKPLR